MFDLLTKMKLKKIIYTETKEGKFRKTFGCNIERNDVANGRNIARNEASKWLLGHNVRPLEVKKDIVIV